MQGKVILVGAGPGDPELLTLKAVKAIAEADVILVDDLVHPDTLAHRRSDARVVHVGKRGGCASTPQAFIEKLMIAEARAGHVVVRLKGGDPFMFGRGGEERAHLRAVGIAVEVVNGITSGVAAASAIGAPLTHRDIASGCIFVTGHARGDGATGQGVRWRELAATSLPLVIYMGVARAAEIQRRLLDAGMRADMPVALIQSATHAAQRHVISCLASMAEDVLRHRIESPAIMVIGEVVALAEAAALRDVARESLARVG